MHPHDWEVTYLVLDVETAGLPRFPPRCPKGVFFPPTMHELYLGSRVIEAAWHAVDADGVPLEGSSFSSLVRPVYPGLEASGGIEPAAQAVHGLGAADVEGAPLDTVGVLLRLRECLQTLWQPRGEGCGPPLVVLVGHNVAYDFNVLAAEMYRLADTATLNWLHRCPLRCTSCTHHSNAHDPY